VKEAERAYVKLFSLLVEERICEVEKFLGRGLQEAICLRGRGVRSRENCRVRLWIAVCRQGIRTLPMLFWAVYTVMKANGVRIVAAICFLSLRIY